MKTAVIMLGILAALGKLLTGNPDMPPPPCYKKATVSVITFMPVSSAHLK